MTISLFIFLGVITFIDLNLNILVCNAKCKWQKTQFVVWTWMKRLQKHVSKIGGNKIYLCSSTCKQQFDKNPSKYGYWYKSWINNSKTSQFRIYRHIFFLSILFCLDIFQHILICMIYNRRIVQYLRILES